MSDVVVVEALLTRMNGQSQIEKSIWQILFPISHPTHQSAREREALSLLERREMHSAGASSYPHVKKYKGTNYPPQFFFLVFVFSFSQAFFLNYFVFSSFFFFGFSKGQSQSPSVQLRSLFPLLQLHDNNLFLGFIPKENLFHSNSKLSQCQSAV